MATRKRKTASAKEETGEGHFHPSRHEVVPTHEKLSKEETAKLLEKYHTNLASLPKIGTTDPALKGLDAKSGDVIKISRKSYTAGHTVFYRGVVDE